MKKLDKKEYVLIGIFVLIVTLVIFLVRGNHKNDQFINTNDNQKSGKYGSVTVPSTFFTVQGCAEKYINTVSSKNKDNILILLNDKYKNKNSINEDNVLNVVDDLEGTYSFKAKKMYQERINNNQTKYYLYGKLIKNILNEIDEGKDYYLIVDIYNDSYTFDVTPYDGKIFREAK